MCYKGNILLCIPVQTACLVLAIINVIVNVFAALYGIIFWWLFFVFVSSLSTGPSSEKIGDVRLKRDVTGDTADDMTITWLAISFAVIFIVIPLVALLNIIFSSLLCHGICERRPKLVKAYFWYGLVITVPMIIVSVLMLCYDHESYNRKITFEAYLDSSHMAKGGKWLLIRCFYHSLFLVLVHFTHKKLLKDSTSTDHIRLVEMQDFADIRLIIDQGK